MAKFGIISNLTRDKGLKLTSEVIEWLENRNCSVLLSEIVASKLNKIDLGYSQDEIYTNSDYLIVLGGDGTLLGAARKAAEKEIPIIGVNIGHLGFITEVEKEDTFFALEKIINNDFAIQERILLEVAIVRNGEKGESIYCLNDVGICKGALSKMIALNAYSNNDFIDRYHADGLVIATPTGSTAYSLSAGGPIVSPEIGVIIVTPICPHTLYSRSIILSDEKKVVVEVLDDPEEVLLSCDGQKGIKLNNMDKVFINKAPHNVKLIKLSNRSFFDVLRNKLRERSI